MKIFVKIITVLIILSLFACDKEEVCVGCNLNPKIKLRFEPVWQKMQIDTLITKADEEISIIEEQLKGQLTANERNELEDELEKVKEEVILLAEELSFFRSGKIRIDLIEAPRAVVSNLFQDTVVRTFSIPIDLHHDTSTYFFNYHGFTDTLQLYYQREIEQTFEGVRMRLSDIGINKDINTFDSIKVKCYNLECSNDRTTIHIYY